MNPVYGDEYTRQILKPIVPESSPKKFITPNGSPQITPTKYRPDGGDRYIPVREDDKEWTKKYAKIDMEIFNVKQKPAAKRNLTSFQHNRDMNSSSHLSNHIYNGSHNNMTISAALNIGHHGSSHHQSPTSNDDNFHDVATHHALLSNELLNDSIVDIQTGNSPNDVPNVLYRQQPDSLFRFANKTPVKHGQPSSSIVSPLFSSSPLSADSQRLLKSPRKPQRKVSKNPYKVLDAPELQDDFYLNLVDWSSQNILSVGLSNCVYLWNAANSQVVKLCDFSSEQDTITSVQWAEKGSHLAVGTNRGHLQIWDTTTQQCISTYNNHSGRIGCLAWNNDIICSGSRDRTIVVKDIRTNQDDKQLNNHRQEVCGLKWSPNKQYLASGGNDNQLLVWNLNRSEPVQTYTEHNAAVKALAWSPHHHGVLVSGGGTADRCLRFWNTLTSQLINCIDTSSQVCNVAWSKHSSELVSTHGYSHNQVILWKYPSMESFARLCGHSQRVLYLAMSPCGESIVTGAGDETLRFWHVFSNTGQQRVPRSPLDLYNAIR